MLASNTFLKQDQAYIFRAYLNTFCAGTYNSLFSGAARARHAAGGSGKALGEARGHARPRRARAGAAHPQPPRPHAHRRASLCFLVFSLLPPGDGYTYTGAGGTLAPLSREIM